MISPISSYQFLTVCVVATVVVGVATSVLSASDDDAVVNVARDAQAACTAHGDVAVPGTPGDYLTGPHPLLTNKAPYEGKITYYSYSGDGNHGSCGYGPLHSWDYAVGVAVGKTEFFPYAQTGTLEPSQRCGVCVRIEGPKGSVIGVIVDSCPTCHEPYPHFDFAEVTQFERICTKEQGQAFGVRFTEVVCPTTKPMELWIRPASNPYFLSVNVVYNRIAIKSLEYRNAGSTQWVRMPRTEYGSWNLQVGSPFQTPLSFRVTAALTGEQIEVHNVNHITNNAPSGTEWDVIRYTFDAPHTFQYGLGQCSSRADVINSTYYDANGSGSAGGGSGGNGSSAGTIAAVSVVAAVVVASVVVVLGVFAYKRRRSNAALASSSVQPDDAASTVAYRQLPSSS